MTKSYYTHKSFATFLLLVICFGIFTNASAQAPEKAIEPKGVSVLTIKDYLKKLGQDPNFQFAQIAFSLKSIASGKTLVDVNAGKSLMIASNTKLVTTAAALEILGEDFTFKTTVEYSGKIDANGTLNGDLILQGGGDPTLGADRFKGFPEMDVLLKLWVEKIKLLKIKKITGNIIADQEIFEENGIPDGWMWMDIGNYYGAAAYGLNINENLYRLYFTKNNVLGASTEVLKTDPIVPDLQFNNYATVAAKGSGDNCFIYGSPYGNARIIQGTIPAGDISFIVKGSIPDPAFLTAHYLKGLLINNGIAVDGTALSSRMLRIQHKPMPNDRKLIHTQVSPLLKDIVKQTNLFSINLYAEALMKMVGYKVAGKGSTLEGTKAIEAFWKTKGIKMPGFYMADGCGLSSLSTFTADQISDILRVTANAKYIKSFKESLPVAGNTGTLSGFCKGTAAEKNVCAKSGNMQRVSSYAGYVNNAGGELLCFTLTFNNFGADYSIVKKKVEKIMTMLAEMK
jgi:D-alanyl-D-alanine carboxypeptidase/D-alanyl-D-alanine-endopeptidase (penicillin-binding protein 4)